MRVYFIPDEKLAKEGAEELIKIKLNKLEKSMDYPKLTDKKEAGIEFAGAVALAESIGMETSRYKEQFAEITGENFDKYSKRIMGEFLYK